MSLLAFLGCDFFPSMCIMHDCSYAIQFGLSLLEFVSRFLPCVDLLGFGGIWRLCEVSIVVTLVEFVSCWVESMASNAPM